MRLIREQVHAGQSSVRQAPPPSLTPDDLEWDGTEEGGRNTFSIDDLTEAGYISQSGVEFV